jgi:hypothetical protein
MRIVACAIMISASVQAQPAAEGEGWRGYAMQLREKCGIDDVILRFTNSVFVADLVELPKADRTAGTKACTACIAADRAIRVFAPLALDARGRHKLAAKLRALPAIYTRAQASKALGRIEPMIDNDPGADRYDRDNDAVHAAFEAVAEAAGPVEPPDDRGCYSYEGGAEYDSWAGKALESAVDAGASKSVARREALRLASDLAWAARKNR